MKPKYEPPQFVDYNKTYCGCNHGSCDASRDCKFGGAPQSGVCQAGAVPSAHCCVGSAPR
jgi:hypothetical protein